MCMYVYTHTHTHTHIIGSSGHLVSRYVAEELPKLLNREVLRRFVGVCV